MEIISGLVNGIPWTQGDPATFYDLSITDQERVLAWISQNIHMSAGGDTISSYSLKHHMERDICLYTTNNQFKHAMHISGYEPITYDELNWEYPVTSDKSPYAVFKAREEKERNQEAQYFKPHVTSLKSVFEPKELEESIIMDNLWLLTEERPKPSVICQIIDMYCADFNDCVTNQEEVKIKPIIENGVFKFVYKVEGLSVSDAKDIFIKTVSGSSSFLDFLLFKQVDAPTEGSASDNLIMAIEETKTSDDESRNTGVYQRGSKFVYITPYYQNVKLYMLYNEELEAREEKKPSDTSVFGTNILLTLGVTIVGKDISRWFKPFASLDELIAFKAGMRQPPAGNVPITIKRYPDRIEVSGRLAKPADAGNIGHDPNIGALSMISACIRKLGWDKDIVITLHGVTQEYVDHTHGKNKFLYICSILGMKLSGIRMPRNVVLPELYWHYEKRSEKMADILLHVQTMYAGQPVN